MPRVMLSERRLKCHLQSGKPFERLLKGGIESLGFAFGEDLNGGRHIVQPIGVALLYPHPVGGSDLLERRRLLYAEYGEAGVLRVRFGLTENVRIINAARGAGIRNRL